MARRDVVEVLREEVAGEGGRAFFGLPSQREVVALRSAPGRLDVMGGLGVQVGGTVAQMALPLRVAVAVQLCGGEGAEGLAIDGGSGAGGQGTLKIAAAEPWEASFFASERAAGICGPIAAMWRVMRESCGVRMAGGAGGARIMVRSDVVDGAGQASSMALLTALSLALMSLVQGPSPEGGGMDPAGLLGLMERAAALCSLPVPGAMIDATTCLLAGQPAPAHSGGGGAGGGAGGTRPGLLRYSAQTCELIGHVPLPGNLRILALDTGVRHPSKEALAELRVAGAMGLRIIETIYRDLGQAHTPLHGYLANTSPLLYRQYFRALLPRRLRGSDFLRTYGALPGKAGEGPGLEFDRAGVYRVRTAVDHLIAENEHAEQFLQAMEELAEPGASGSRSGAEGVADAEERQRTLQRAGRLALASHHSYRLRLELSCREADWLVDHLMEAGPERGIYGARITGAGGGGTVMALVDQSASAGEAVLEAIEAYRRVMGLRLSVVEAGTAGSAGALWEKGDF